MYYLHFPKVFVVWPVAVRKSQIRQAGEKLDLDSASACPHSKNFDARMV
jgi:hypothetical protein